MAEFEETVASTTERMAALTRLGILDTLSEVEFDDIVLLATELCRAPVALVSLVADRRQWFKARLGFPECQTPLDQSVCKYAMNEDDVLVIPDLRLDPRTAANTLVTGDPFIRFYAGAPLRDINGVPIGSLCVIDTEARPGGLTPSQTAGLSALAQLVVALLEARRLLVQERQRKDAEHAATLLELKDERRMAELRERFVAVLSHDLRNPLTAVDAGLRIIARDPTSATARSVVDMMKLSVARMTRLIENTLNFARTRLSGGLSVTIQSDAPLLSVLGQVVAELQLTHPEASIETRIELTEPVTCDADRIGQLFSNLLSNALTHGDTAEAVLVTAATRDHQFTLTVANAGPPISSAVLAHIYQPFTSGEESSPKGLGLGLYTASEIARAHGGHLEVTSADEGTSFTFQMPLDGTTS